MKANLKQELRRHKLRRDLGFEYRHRRYWTENKYWKVWDRRWLKKYGTSENRNVELIGLQSPTDRRTKLSYAILLCIILPPAILWTIYAFGK